MIKLNKRQLKILEYIKKKGNVSNREIVEYLKDVSRITIIRDLNFLLKNEFIEKTGKGRSIVYKEKTKKEFLKYIDVDKYFEKEFHQREIKFKMFNFDVFNIANDIFNKKELESLNEMNLKYQKRIKKISKDILKKEFERLTIELSWKSSQIEGNTYSLLDTEILIKEKKEAEGKKREEAIMILNHKNVLDYILKNKNDFKKLSLSKIEDINEMIVKNIIEEKGLRKRPVGIIGTEYKPIDNQFQIKEAMEKLIKVVNELKNPFSKSLFSILMISYIQPFIDGNKRTARILGNAILLANGICPLSYRSVDEKEYKKALIIFYEQNNIRAFKDLFIEQYKFAVDNYFL